VTIPRLPLVVPSLEFPFGLLSRIALLVLCLMTLGFIWTSTSACAAEPAHDKPYALIFGTVWGPDDHPVFGVKIKIRRVDQKKARWELYSDHNGEFAQRLPAGEADYVVWADLKDYKSPIDKPLQLVSEVKVHIYNDERADIGLHLK
jgi:hypothetical protein